ncbi:MAG: helix-turn-helix transcriptional regulator [Acidiferrobacterales bacterium]
MPKGDGRKRGSAAYNPIDVHVGARLRARRTLLGMSQTALGDALGITFQQQQKYETGSNRISASRLYDVSKLLGVDIGYFFDEMDRATEGESPARLIQKKSKWSSQKPPKSENPLHKRETLEFVRAYYRIKDPKIRGYVRKLIQTTASASSPST